MIIDKQIELQLANMPEAPAGLSAEQLKLFNVCAAYKIVKPVLVLAKKLLKKRPKLILAIDTLMGLLDATCSTE